MPRILLIEDDERTRRMLREMTERAGYEVVDVANGELGLRAQRGSGFDLVITDILMPDKEGIETIMELRRDYPDLPVIAISGGGSAGGLDYLTVARSLGARYTFAKPVDRQELLGAIASVFAE
ncbi:MAG TPA: response regulator [Acidobacteria bacterium]|nr:response regulator [Acidobacteriota bacterium]